MRGKLVDYGSSDEEDSNSQSDKAQEIKQQQQQKVDKKQINQKRTIDYSKLATLKPFKQQRIQDSEDNEDNWQPQTQEELQKQKQQTDQNKNNKSGNKGGLMFKLSKPEKELKNYGEEIQNKKSSGGMNFSSYDDLVKDKEREETQVKNLPQFQNSGITMQKKVLGKMTEVLGKELNEEEENKVKLHDKYDNMFIDHGVQEKADLIYKNMENQEQGIYDQQEEEEEYDEQYHQEQEENFKEMQKQLINKHNKREQKFLENMIDIDGKELHGYDWQGQQEKAATSKELMAQNKITMPLSTQAKGKNKIQTLAQSVMAQDSIQVGQYRGGSAQQRTRSRYGW